MCARTHARAGVCVCMRGRAQFIERVPLSLPLLPTVLLPLPPAQAAAAWVVPLSLHFGELLLSS